jgi:uncharacterized membrane protein HdeD (DUF308 family)
MQTARDMTASLPGRPMLHALAKCWWLLLLRGIAAVLFGLLAFIWPGLTLVTLVLLYGAFALVDGVISLVAAFTGSAKPIPTWWLVVVGLLGIAAGIVTFAWPGITAILLVLFIGAWALVHGIFEIIGAIQLRKEIDNEWMLILGGALSVLFGRIVLIAPGAGASCHCLALHRSIFGPLSGHSADTGMHRERGLAALLHDAVVRHAEHCELAVDFAEARQGQRDRDEQRRIAGGNEIIRSVKEVRAWLSEADLSNLRLHPAIHHTIEIEQLAADRRCG